MDSDEPRDPAFESRIIRSFIRDGRLTRIPARERRRQVIDRSLLSQVFTADRTHAEKEIDQRLAPFHPDVATIRHDPAGHGRCPDWSHGTAARTVASGEDQRPPRSRPADR